jgi:hypothetical protein
MPPWPPRLKILKEVQSEDGSFRLVQNDASEEDWQRSEVLMAVKYVIHGDLRPLVQILFSRILQGRTLDPQERGLIQGWLEGKHKISRGQAPDFIVRLAAGEVKRRGHERGVKRDAVVTRVAADYGVTFEALDNLLRRSKKPRSKKCSTK